MKHSWCSLLVRSELIAHQNHSLGTATYKKKLKEKKKQILRWFENGLEKKNLTDEDNLQQTATLTSVEWIKYDI